MSYDPPSGGYQQYGQPPSVPPKKPLPVAVVATIVVLVVAAGGFGAYFLFRGDGSSGGSGGGAPRDAVAGDCVKFVGDDEAEVLDCAVLEATFRVGVRVDGVDDGCPDGDYDQYMEYLEPAKIGGFTLCLMLNAEQGDCFVFDGEDDRRVGCGGAADHPRGVEIVGVVDGVADDAECDDQSIGLVYSEPPTTMCYFEFALQDNGSGGGSSSGSSGGSGGGAPRDAVAGDCVKFVGDDEAEVLDCAVLEATFRVGVRVDGVDDGCPDGDYDQYMEYLEPAKIGGFTLCLMLNAEQGDCFVFDGEDDRRVGCGGAADHPRGVEIVGVVDGVADDAECDDQSIGLVYSEPPTTMCYEATS